MAVNTDLTLVVPTPKNKQLWLTWPGAAQTQRCVRGRSSAAAKNGRHGYRDATMLLVAYRHGLRASELTDLRWDQVDFSTANMHVRRAKKGARTNLKAKSAEIESVVQSWQPARGLEVFCPPLHQSRCSWRTIEGMAGIKICRPQLMTEPLFETADA